MLPNLFKIPFYEFVFGKDGVVCLLNETITLKMHKAYFENIVGPELVSVRKFYFHSHSTTFKHITLLLSFLFILSNKRSVNIQYFASSTSYFSTLLDKLCFQSIGGGGCCQILHTEMVSLTTITTSKLLKLFLIAWFVQPLKYFKTF